MVDRYCRKIENVENDIENSIQISSILLKLKGYDEKLGDLSKIDTNKNNISSNLRKIDKNKEDISSNLGKITTSEGAISSNLGKIDNNKEDISSNLGKITTNERVISSYLGKITTNEGAISSNLGKIDNIKEFLIYSEDFKKKLLILKNKYLDLIKPHIFILFLKKRLHMISLEIVYYS